MGRNIKYLIKYCQLFIKAIFTIILSPFMLIYLVIKIIFSIILGIINIFNVNNGLDAQKELEKMQNDSRQFISEYNQNQKQKSSSINNTKYDDYFTYIIRQRGHDYYHRNLVNNLKRENNTYTATVSGTKNYKVSFEIDTRGLRRLECECPYFQSGEGNCKHLYAALLKCQEVNPINNITDTNKIDFNELLNLIDQMEALFEEATDLYNEYDSNSELEDLYFELEEFQDNINKYKELKLKDLNNTIVEEAKYDYDQMENIYQAMQDILEEVKEDNHHRNHLKNNKEDSAESLPYGYEPYNFEEEDLEEDDYYFEDEDLEEDDYYFEDED